MKRKNLFQLGLAIVFALSLSSCEKILDKVDDELDENRSITESIVENTTWKSGQTYIVDGTIRVGGSDLVTLTIEAGAIVKFNEGSTLDIGYWDDQYAKVIAKGNSDNPIIFTSSNPNPSAGDWDVVAFYKGATDCVFEYCEFKNGGGNDYYGNIYVQETDVSFSNCLFSNSASSAIVLRDAAGFSTFNNNTFSNTFNYAISIYPEFIHTIGINNSFNVDDKIYVDASEDLNNAGNYQWRNQGVPYVFDGVMRVGSSNTAGVNITIDAGTILNFTNDSYIDFSYWDDTYSSIVANGTELLPVVFTSNSPSPEAGDWESLNFYKGSNNSSFNYCVFEYGGDNDYYGNIYITDAAVSFTHCSFTNTTSYGIKLKDNAQFSAFSDNTFKDHGMFPISTYPSGVHTIGINNVFESGSSILVDADEDLHLVGTYTWLKQNVPYTMDGLMRIGNVNGTTLILNAGIVLAFTSGSEIEVSYWDEDVAALIANGTSDEPVVFTSNSPAPTKGDWDGISFHENVSGSLLNNCIIEYAGGNDYYGSFALAGSGSNTVSLKNSTISNSNSHAITVDDDSSLDYSTVVFSNNNGEDYHVR